MSVRMVVLGLLQEKPLYGYEIKQLIIERMGDWADIKFGSIYFALNKLAKEGFLEREETPGLDNRPVRFIYTITERGRKEFRRLLKECWTKEFQLTFPFDLALYFEDYLSDPEKISALEERTLYLTRALNYLKKHREAVEENPAIPGMAAKIINHTELHFKAELQWLKSIEV